MRVADTLEELKDALSRCRFPLPCSDAGVGRAAVRELSDQLEDYILPRYRSLDAPLVAVVGGSTGSGKSLIVNSLARQHVARSTAIRPTTRMPLLVHAPQDLPWFDSQRILPGLARVSRIRGGEGEDGLSEGAAGEGVAGGRRRPDAGGAGEDGLGMSGQAPSTQSGASASRAELELVAHDAPPPGLAILDSPDIDSVVEDNRKLAAQLLSAADLWIFVTTAARYSDAIPWALLHEAAERNIVLAVVLNRVPDDAGDLILPDLRRKLDEGGLGGAPIFMIPEQKDAEGFIPEENVAPLKAWLTALAQDASSRAEVARRTLLGATDALLAREPDVVVPLQTQVDTRSAMEEQVGAAFDVAQAQVEAALEDGSLLRNEVVARWQEVVGTGEWTARLESGVSSLRDKVAGWFRGSKSSPAAVEHALEDSLQLLLVSSSEDAVAQSARAWLANPASAVEVEAATSSSPTYDQRNADAALAVREWQRDLVGLVSSTGKDKRTTARIMAVGVNLVGAALIIVIFASTAGLTGAEVAVAGGTAVAAQKLLEAIFGDDAVRKMAETAREDLLARTQAFFDADKEPFVQVLEGLEKDSVTPGDVQQRFAAARDAAHREAL